MLTLLQALPSDKIVNISPALLGLIIVGLGATSAIARRSLSSLTAHWIHTAWGAALLMFLSMLLGGLASSFQQGGLTMVAVYTGISSALSGFVGWYSPLKPDDNANTKIGM